MGSGVRLPWGRGHSGWLRTGMARTVVTIEAPPVRGSWPGGCDVRWSVVIGGVKFRSAVRRSVRAKDLSSAGNPATPMAAGETPV